MKRDYCDSIQDMLNAINNIRTFIGGIDQQQFASDLKTVLAVIKSIEIIGEATKNIPSEIKDKYPEMPWRKMMGMRDKLAHHYFGIDLQMLWDTATDSIPVLEEPLRRVLHHLNTHKSE